MKLLQTFPGTDSAARFVTDVLSGDPRSGVLIFLAALVVYSLWSKNFGAWIASLLLVVAGLCLALFPETASLSAAAAAAAGIGAAVVVSASRRRAKLVEQFEQLQMQVQSIAVEQERRKLRDLKSERSPPYLKSEPSPPGETGAPSLTNPVQRAATPMQSLETVASAHPDQSPRPDELGTAQVQGARHSE